jgi:tRNA A37 threonylcarbamoyladenosine dehydratase
MPVQEHFTDRTERLLGVENQKALSSSRVAIYGLGGVGASCAMDLVRSGIGSLYVVDFDIVTTSNLNRLYFGYSSVVGMPKTEALKKYALDINPDIQIESVQRYFDAEDVVSVIDNSSNIHGDCIDSLAPKIRLIAELCKKSKICISSMGMAGRMAPERLRLGSIWESSGCPLAKRVRSGLKAQHIDTDFPAVWSDEPAVKPTINSIKDVELHPCDGNPAGQRKFIQSSAPFVPQAAGHLMASWIVRKLIGMI